MNLVYIVVMLMYLGLSSNVSRKNKNILLLEQPYESTLEICLIITCKMPLNTLCTATQLFYTYYRYCVC